MSELQDREGIMAFIAKMPALPTTVSKIVAIANDVNSSVRDLVKVIRLDPILLAKVLKVINSSYFGQPEPVTQISSAVIMLGMNTVKNLALSTAVVGVAGSRADGGSFDMDAAWAHSVGVGVAAKLIAKHMGAERRMLEQYLGEDEFRRTAEEVLEYVQRDMTSPEGGFYSAEDADSEGEEGLFYLWTADELREVLGADEAALFARAFGVEAEGNFRDEATQRRSGRNILHLARPLAELAADLEVEEGALRARLDEARGKLFRMREKRIHPLKDDKVLTDWNGLMIAAFARAGQAFDDERYVEAAARAAGFVLAELAPGGGRLLKRWRDGEAGLPGTLEDHAFLTWGLLELWEATFDVRWLRAAIEITDAMIEHFHDDVRGAFFLTADDGEELFVRGKEIFDGAIPSGNSVAALDLLRLARITGEVRYEELAAETMRAFSGEVTRSPGVFTMLMTAVDFAEGPSYEVVIAGDAQAEDTQAMLRAIRSRFLPHKVVVRRSAEGDGAPVTEIAEYAKPQTSLDGRATAYVCRQFTCEAPTTDVEVVLRSLEARD